MPSFMETNSAASLESSSSEEEEEEDLEEEEEISTEESVSSNTTTGRGLTVEEKRSFLADIDANGGLLEASKNIQLILDQNPHLYGDKNSIAGQKKQKQFKNLLTNVWLKKFKAGTFESERLSLASLSVRSVLSSPRTLKPSASLPSSSLKKNKVDQAFLSPKTSKMSRKTKEYFESDDEDNNGTCNGTVLFSTFFYF